MNSGAEPLEYPNHYPPTDRWKKFFIGVRWLGPDLSFFKELNNEQAARTAIQMNAWGGGLKQTIAQRISEILVRRLKWKNLVFLPSDELAVVVNGPRFDPIDNCAFEEIIEHLERAYQISLKAHKFNTTKLTLGEFVDTVVIEIEAKQP